MDTNERSTDAHYYQRIPRAVVAMPREYDYLHHTAPHTHERAQLLYAVEGVMRVNTELGVWILPPRRALLIAPGVEHGQVMLSKVSMRTLYIDAASAASFGSGCKVIEVSSLLRELILALVAEPAEYPVPGRGEHLAMLILSELAAAQTVPIAIPWPRDRRLVAVCSAIMAAPGSRRSIEEWAEDAGASARTLIRLFPKETGLHYRQWVQQVHLADAFCRLARGDSVGEIGRALGYASPSAFTAMFRRLLGKTPQDYLSEWR
ncbi:AraC family transcriptional regulator [Janthinobacterium agaricidamnosum]|uniref:Bacterial regulatory helix-turn-helix s, AraC family protein n=1 Tax=Janthinobacterium agaricidamnosum NBRC 102515 = DSM 9628 TaxID=1349767 RepID=W0V033_9BURK|nr:helix-turn-helix transcriptional regulator [Janthinobacterium agaricidamnosum]CDG82189.1 bacterial regulatory helix-turn-helix s, AraC family protein [Janthinobacterium agaricidamnosum NBRC 102515 = DSM 9628]